MDPPTFALRGAQPLHQTSRRADPTLPAEAEQVDPEQLERKAREIEAEYADLSNWAVIADAPGASHIRAHLVIQLRLMEAIDKLTGELSAFEASFARAADAADNAGRRMEQMTSRLLLLTVVLVLLTLALIFQAAIT